MFFVSYPEFVAVGGNVAVLFPATDGEKGFFLQYAGNIGLG